MDKLARYGNMDRLIELMEERDNDRAFPPTMVDRGYSLAVMHMKEEIDTNNEYHIETFVPKYYEQELINAVLSDIDHKIDEIVSEYTEVDTNTTADNAKIISFSEKIKSYLKEIKEKKESED